MDADPFTRQTFQGVYAKDFILNTPTTDPSGYIINLDTSDCSKTRRITMFIDQKNNESNYFDSYGLPPIPTCLPTLQLCTNVVHNPIELQDNTMVCGQSAIMFLLIRARGFSFQQTIYKLNHSRNDEILHSLFHNLFPKRPFYPPTFSLDDLNWML